MIDKNITYNIARTFIDVFETDPFEDLIKIKSAIDVVGYERWKEIVEIGISKSTNNIEENLTRFKNSIALTVIELNRDNEMAARIHFTKALNFGFTGKNSHIGDLSVNNIFMLIEILSETAHYSYNSEYNEFDATNFDHLVPEIAELHRFSKARVAINRYLRANFKLQNKDDFTSQCMLWEAEYAVFNDRNILTTYGPTTYRRLKPFFGKNRLQKCVFLIFDILESDVQLKPVMVKRWIENFLSEEMDELEAEKDGQIIENEAWEPYWFKSLEELIYITLQRYGEDIEELVDKDRLVQFSKICKTY